MTDAAQGKSWKTLASWVFAVGGGFILSFIGLGVLWIGTPWHYQALMFFPFLLLSFSVTRIRNARDNVFLLVLYGAMPIGALMVMFRDKNNSHLMPILMVCTWVAGILLGHYLAGKSSRKETQAGKVNR
jgi:hypothetical protein